MPLVDYPSDSDDSEPASGTDHADSDPGGPPPNKKQRTGTPPALPPLPAAFHDLYAATVRTTTRDDPGLHQGRTRQIPHVAGNWPSHIYVEWHPPPPVHALLANLVSSLQEQARKAAGPAEVTSFLLSDLGAPQPLHISLSRPIALSSAEKDRFLAEVEGTFKSSGLAAFGLGCSRVEWHRTAESGRSFLVLRVYSRHCAAPVSDGDAQGEHKDEDAKSMDNNNNNPNPELTALLRRCNSVVAKYGQPELYRWADAEDAEGQVGNAFHVSIAWSFAEPTDELKSVTDRVFGGNGARQRIRDIQIPVDGVKVKIGNAVTHVALRQPGKMALERGVKNLLGL
ncbi:U6 snRNA phosphodiesterase Usb1 [Chaetomium strumarium]|uniref:U6 snRNA phosphodiesterase n=1 Tax=Chaetomium strumarium TaxID=1170767 RepID=A0AAJ0M658_9PEZI|nr:U6 snRNA phosphodiesterase Usb1 [Chaetomium strumarium]